MESSAAERVLLLPELLAIIIDLLEDDYRTLFSAIRVTTLWHRQGISVLWRAPVAQALLRIPKERRQVFANNIQCIGFFRKGDDIAHSQYKELKFPQLRYLGIDKYRPKDRLPWIRQYLQPNLREFDFHGGTIHDDLCQLLPHHCPRLTSLLIDRVGKDFPWADMVDLLKQLPELEDVELSSSWAGRGVVPADVFGYLVERDSLKRLRLRDLIAEETVQHIDETVVRPFPKLKDLSLYMDSEVLPAVASMCKGVTEIYLDVWPISRHRAISCLSPLQDLEVLVLNPRHDQDMKLKDLLALTSFKKLRELHLPAGSSDPIQTWGDICDDVFECLPQLQHITLGTEVMNTEDLLIALGENCPLLETCDLTGCFYFEKLEPIEEPLFPSLKELKLSFIGLSDPESKEAVQAAVNELRRHAPNLEKLDVLDDEGDFCDHMMPYLPAKQKS